VGNPTGISAPATVPEGDILVIQVHSKVDYVSVLIQGHGTVKVRVVEGEARYLIPQGVSAGSVVTITDDLYPDPSTATVIVVGLNP